MRSARSTNNHCQSLQDPTLLTPLRVQIWMLNISFHVSISVASETEEWPYITNLTNLVICKDLCIYSTKNRMCQNVYMYFWSHLHSLLTCFTSQVQYYWMLHMIFAVFLYMWLDVLHFKMLPLTNVVWL